MSCVGCIGGTGLEQLPGFEPSRSHTPVTRWGQPSGPVREGRLGGSRLLYLHRHGGPEAIPPHAVNYRANMQALRDLGAGVIVAVNAVGGITAGHEPGSLLLPDQIIDYTWGREHTVDEGTEGALMHIDFTHPYDPGLRGELLCAARECGIAVHDGGVMGVTQGPRLETAAEVRRLERDGCDVVGMTGMPEASLARELGLLYASICIVVNRAAGLGEGIITLEEIREVLCQRTQTVGELVAAFLRARSGV